MTNPTSSSDPELVRLAEVVAECAAKLAETTIRGADKARADAIVELIAGSPRGTRNCDLMMALAVAVAVQAQCVSDDIGCSKPTAISIIASALGLLAQNVHAVELPTDPKQIN